MLDTRDWKHVFKLDPEKKINDDDLERICTSDTNGIIVGGTYGVTYDNTLQLLTRVRRYAKPCILEVSRLEAIVPGFDHYFIPFVLNAMEPEWMLKPYHQALKKYGSLVPWGDISLVGYCVLNPNSGVAQLTKSETQLSLADIIAYGQMASRLFHLPYFYLEYSGAFGPIETLSEVYTTLKQDMARDREPSLQVFYGGGIKSFAQRLAMSTCADTLVVGNVIYEDIEAALETVGEEKSHEQE